MKILAFVLVIFLNIWLFSIEPDQIFLKKLAIFPEHPAAGALFRIHAISSSSANSMTALLQTSGGTLISRFQGYSHPEGGVRHWILPMVIPANLADEHFMISLESPGLSPAGFMITTSGHAFHSETIEFNTTMSDLKTIPDPQKNRESAELYAVLRNFEPSCPPNTAGFILPVEGIRKTAFFGDRRIYAYSNGSTEKTLHYGIDFGGDRLAIHSPADGIVVMARRRLVTGNTVVLQHAPGLFSLYYHLSTISVSVGQRVSTTDILGASGATGLVTGPHLHWEFRNQGEPVDPEALMAHEHIDIDGLTRILSFPLLP